MIPNELLIPITTFPKFTLLGITVSCVTGAKPEPVKVTVVGELSASLVIVKVPEEPPEEDGVNLICNVALCPAGMEDKGVPWVIVKAAPEIVV